MDYERIELSVPEESSLERVDKFLSGALEKRFSRSYIQKLIDRSMVDVNGVRVKSNHRLKSGDAVTVIIPPPEKADIVPEDIELDIVYEDSSIAVINKSPGMVVHPGPGNRGGTLVNAIMHSIDDLSSIGGMERPGIVHRLDKDTSGLIVIAKNDAAHRSLSDEFSGRRVYKKYAAIVTGRMDSGHGIIDLPIGRHPVHGSRMAVVDKGRAAVTEFTVERYWSINGEMFSLLDVRIHTGRTHQIRVHLSSRGNPVVGDPVYSRRWRRHNVDFMMLASVQLGFRHPETGDDLFFEAGLPEHFLEFIKKLDSKSVEPI